MLVKLSSVSAARPAFYCGVTITEEREMRFVDFNGAALQRVAQRSFRCAQVFSIKVARLIEHFSMADGDCRSGCALRLQTDPTNEVLTEVNHRFACGSLEDSDGLYLFDLAHRRPGGRCQNRFGIISDFNCTRNQKEEARTADDPFAA